MNRILLFLLSLCLLLTACQSQSAPSSDIAAPSASVVDEPSTAVTFTDSLGREVSVDNPQRVAALIGSFADIWCLAGGKDSLVAAANDTWTSFELGLGEDVANLGAIKEPNLEVLLASEPDLILASSSTAADVELLDTLEMAGLNVVYFEVSNFQEYRDMLDICTQITGQRDHYVQYGEELEKEIQRAVERADGSTPSVLYVRATGSGCKVKNSQGSVLGEMLADLGCVNIADSQTSLLESLSLEVILQEDPDFIFLVMQGSDQAAVEQVLNETLLSNPAWQSLTAVQEGRCHVMDEKLYNLKPNARWGEAYENLAEILYPDN